MKPLALVFVCIWAPIVTGSTFSGTVTDPSGAVVPGVSITLTHHSTGRAHVVSSDSDGRFRAKGLAAGDYQFIAVSPGFAPFQQDHLTIAEGESRTLDVALRISAQSEHVTVRAKAPPDEGMIETSSRNVHEVLESREVRESAAKDVAEALSHIDGVWKIRKGGIANDVVVRGFQQGNINVLIDGQRIYAACPGHMDPAAYHLDFAELEAVDVTKGPFNVRDQGSLGSTVNVVSKKPQAGFHFTPNFSMGSFGFYNPSLVASASKGAVSGLAGYSFRQSDPFKDGAGRRVTDYAAYVPSADSKTAFDIHTAWGQFQAALPRNQNISLSFTRQSAGLTLYPALRMDAPYDHADRANLNWTIGERPGLVQMLRVQAYFSRVKHWMTDEYRTGAVGSPLGYSMGTFAGSRALGGRIEAELPNTVIGLEAYDRGWSVVGAMRMGMMYTVQHSLPDVRLLVGGSYLQHRRNFGKFDLTVGGRLDLARSDVRSATFDPAIYWAYHSTRATAASDLNPSGNVRITYPLPMGIQLFVGAGSSVRLPDPQERFYGAKGMGSDWVGNPALNPTRNNEVDAGLNFRGRHFSLRPTIFYSRLSDFIAINFQAKRNAVMGIMNSAARTYEGVDACIYGGELAYSIGFSRSLLLSGGISLVRGIQREKISAGMPGTNIAEMPPLKSRAALRYGRSLFFAEINGLASARQDKIDTRMLEQPTAGYALLGIKAGIHHRQWNIAGGADNLTNRLYFEHLSYQRDPFRSGVRIPEPGRTLYVNISFTLE